MANRVEKLIENLRFTKDPLGYACNHLGFDKSDLSLEEIDALHSEIFQCERCGRWEPANEQIYDFGLGRSVCVECFRALEELED